MIGRYAIVREDGDRWSHGDGVKEDNDINDKIYINNIISMI